MIRLLPQETASLRIPAFTAYTAPNADPPEVSERGITHWSDPKAQIFWYGYLSQAGPLQLAVALSLSAGSASRLALTVSAVGGKALSTLRQQIATSGDTAFGTVTIPRPGYYRFALSGIERRGAEFGDVMALVLSGAAANGAHFNQKERRNAASVHLGYPVPKTTKVTWFYNEVTVKTDPLHSYYMACGFARGYFGIQVNSPTERRVIFSIWDSGNEAVDRSKVDKEDRVQLLAKGDGVVASDFGNEGTGGHSHLVYPWKKDTTYRFLVSAEPDGTHTTYSGYFYFPERNVWGLIARFRAPKDGNYLSGLYSFNENFWGNNGDLQRLAEFGNQWIKTVDGAWTPLTTARFTCDATGKAKDRLDFGAGVAKSGNFYLSNGGFVASGISFGDTFTRPQKTNTPPQLKLP